MNITVSLMKYNMARGYLWWAHARCTPLRNYAMQQIWYKGGLLGEGIETDREQSHETRQRGQRRRGGHSWRTEKELGCWEVLFICSTPGSR